MGRVGEVRWLVAGVGGPQGTGPLWKAARGNNIQASAVAAVERRWCTCCHHRLAGSAAVWIWIARLSRRPGVRGSPGGAWARQRPVALPLELKRLAGDQRVFVALQFAIRVAPKVSQSVMCACFAPAVQQEGSLAQCACALAVRSAAKPVSTSKPAAVAAMQQASRSQLVAGSRACLPVSQQLQLRRRGCPNAGPVRRQCRARAQQESEPESPDWDRELAIFKQRTLKPSQLEVQRKLVAENVDLGRVSGPLPLTPAATGTTAALAAASSCARPHLLHLYTHFATGAVRPRQCGDH